jgi:hypothetical protein
MSLQVISSAIASATAVGCKQYQTIHGLSVIKLPRRRLFGHPAVNTVGAATYKLALDAPDLAVMR